MDNFVKLLALLGVAAQAYALARLPVPTLPGTTAAFRQKPGTVSMAVVTAVVALMLQAIVLLAAGDPWVRLIFWAAAMLSTAVSTSLSFTGVRYGEEGFAARDALGRRRVVRWEDVLAAETAGKITSGTIEAFVGYEAPQPLERRQVPAGTPS